MDQNYCRAGLHADLRTGEPKRRGPCAGDVASDGQSLSGADGTLGGTRLIHRSTRKLTLTAAGEKVLQNPQPDATVRMKLPGRPGERCPAARFASPATLTFTAMQLISPLLPIFSPVIPSCVSELDINNHPVSSDRRKRIDVAIRITDNPEPGAIARRLGSVVVRSCAHRRAGCSYGQPQTPAEL